MLLSYDFWSYQTYVFFASFVIHVILDLTLKDMAFEFTIGPNGIPGIQSGMTEA